MMYQTEVITPETAALMPCANEGNRIKKPFKIAEFAADMRAGRWSMNGETIKVSRTGRLLDGQNRLEAVIRAGVPVEFLVIRDLDDESQETMDLCTPRSVADNLTMGGMAQAKRFTAISRLIYAYEAGEVHVGRGLPRGTSSVEFIRYARSLDLSEAMSITNLASHHGFSGAVVLGAAFEVSRRVEPEMARRFFGEQVVRGIGLTEEDTAYALRRLAMARAGSASERTDIFWLALRGFEAVRRGERLARIQTPKSGWNNASVCRPDRLKVVA